MKLFRRLARTSSEELLFRAGERLRTAREAALVAAGRHAWRREDLAARLDTSIPSLEGVIRFLRSHAWGDADREFRAHFRRRPRRFLIDPAADRRLAESILTEHPNAATESADRAERILNGHFDLLGYRGLRFGPAETPDWHLDPVHDRRMPVRFWTRVPYLDPAGGDHKIIWEMNRHQHFLALGRAAWLTRDPRYADAFVRHLESWMAANPPFVGVNWASMLELAFRSLSWVWALHFFSAASLDDREPLAPWPVDLLLALDRQMEHVASHLSLYFSPNTHLLGEALALYVVGTVVPELRASARWREVGRRVLLREATAQVNPDGGHAELSAHYHRYALDFYLLALAIARLNGDRATEPALTDVCIRMATFCRALADERGHLPTIGDDDGGLLFPICGRDAVDASDTLSLAASQLERAELAVGEPPEEVLWMLGGNRSALVRPGSRSSVPSSVRFEHTGYVVLKAPGEHLIVDAGRHGFLNGGHAHADALSLVLTVDGIPLLIDPGTATYTMDAEARDRFRSSAMHNTLAADGRTQSEPDGPFHWRTRNDASVYTWRPASAFDFVEAAHDGFAPLSHRRAVFATREHLWIVVDHVLGRGSHTIDTYWHLHPAWQSITRASGAIEFGRSDGRWAALASTASSIEETIGGDGGLGWWAPVYGRVEPAPTLKMKADVRLPASIVTAIAAGLSARSLHVEQLPVAADAEDGWHRTGVMVSDGTLRRIALFATPLPDTGKDAPRAPYRAVTPDGTLATDARVAVLCVSNAGEPLTLSLVDGQAARWTGAPPMTLRLPAPAADLHLDIAAQRRLSRTGESQRLG